MISNGTIDDVTIRVPNVSQEMMDVEDEPDSNVEDRNRIQRLQEEELQMEENRVDDFNIKVNSTNRKERLESLRDRVRKFEVKLDQFSSTMEQGFEVTMWQLNMINDNGIIKKDNFNQKSTLVHIKMNHHDGKVLQAVLTFKIIRGYFRKVLSRHRDII